MKKILAILFLIIGIDAYAVDFTQEASPVTTPTATMQSVNNSAYLSTGSDYSSNVYEVSSSGPARPAGVRKAPPGTDNTGYDPNNPQFAPLGDAIIPLLLMVMVYATTVLLRRRKSRV